MSRFTHTEARALVSSAFASLFGRQATRPEAQCLQAIAGLETGYGSSWHGVGVGSFNMGAIQCGPWTGDRFSYTDTHPNADGTSTPYKIDFRKYATAEAGFLDLARVVYQAFSTRTEALACAGRGDLLGFSAALHKYPCYYEGFGATDAIRIQHHHAAVVAQIKAQCAEIGDPFPGVDAPALPSVTPALLIGCTGPAVSAWQAVIGVAPDGAFGPATQAATRTWQIAHGLPPNGVVQQPELKEAGMS